MKYLLLYLIIGLILETLSCYWYKKQINDFIKEKEFRPIQTWIIIGIILIILWPLYIIDIIKELKLRK